MRRSKIGWPLMAVAAIALYTFVKFMRFENAIFSLGGE